MGHAAATKPAFIRVKLDRRLPFFRVGCQFIAHADINTGVAARANILVEVDRFEGHPIPPFNVFQRSLTGRSIGSIGLIGFIGSTDRVSDSSQRIIEQTL
jgi:hypothetical protein